MKERYSTLDMNDKLIWNFRDIAHTMRHTSEGKGSQKRVLMLLNESKGMTQKELTNRLGVQPASVSEVIGKLEASGLVCRTTSDTDRRTADIHLTEVGEVKAQEALSQRQERHQQMFEALSPEEKESLLKLLEKINSDWDQKYRKREAE